jgi:hypothetical protein
MKTLNLKLMVDADEHKAIQAMTTSLRMTAEQYLAHCMRIGHAKIVGDINRALELARAEKEGGQ